MEDQNYSIDQQQAAFLQRLEENKLIIEEQLVRTEKSIQDDERYLSTQREFIEAEKIGIIRSKEFISRLQHSEDSEFSPKFRKEMLSAKEKEISYRKKSIEDLEDSVSASIDHIAFLKDDIQNKSKQIQKINSLIAKYKE